MSNKIKLIQANSINHEFQTGGQAVFHVQYYNAGEAGPFLCDRPLRNPYIVDAAVIIHYASLNAYAVLIDIRWNASVYYRKVRNAV
ncbi:MAG: hypothetical protein GF344_04255, partial [Chitinivibrionales bacterium]|nr:hypothetical protein [Chitinivibrionales bacterium]MBD3356257.1 hypothetical protein [Chitinivibrionales bacterium]